MKESNSLTTEAPNLAAGIRSRQKAIWESGDFGQIARTIEPVAQEFMSRISIRAGDRVLDLACGTGNLAVLAARQGANVTGLDIASNLIHQARARAAREGLSIWYDEGDAESLPYDDASFDTVVSMFGVMFAPNPEQAAREMLRVAKPGGTIALANWTREGFIGKMFEVFRRHIPPQPGVPSPMLWGDEAIINERLGAEAASVTCNRRAAVMRYPFPPAETVDFFRRYYGPTHRAFAALDESRQKALRRDLVELQSKHNSATRSGETEARAEYLEILAIRRTPEQHHG